MIWECKHNKCYASIFYSDLDRQPKNINMLSRRRLESGTGSNHFSFTAVPVLPYKT